MWEGPGADELEQVAKASHSWADEKGAKGLAGLEGKE